MRLYDLMDSLYTHWSEDVITDDSLNQTLALAAPPLTSQCKSSAGSVNTSVRLTIYGDTFFMEYDGVIEQLKTEISE